MIIKCSCETCSHYDDEICMLETGRPIGTAPDDWCLGLDYKETKKICEQDVDKRGEKQ